MKAANQYITDAYINSFKQAGKPLTLKNLNRGSINGIFFYNSSRGSKFQNSNKVDFVYNADHVSKIELIKQQTAGEFNFVACIKWLDKKQPVGSKFLREGVIYDKNDHMIITVWEDLLDKIQEECCYHFYNIQLKDYFGLKLTTNRSSTIVVAEDENFTIAEEVVESYRQHIKATNKKLNPVLCCPKIQNLLLDVSPGCTNPNCRKPVTIMPKQRTVQCIHCNSTMRADHCKCNFECRLTFDANDMSLQLPLDVLITFLGKDVLNECQNDIDAFKESLLFLESVDYHYNLKGSITYMERHDGSDS